MCVLVMITVFKAPACLFSPQDDKVNRFDLVVINRVFQFSADSLEDSQVWISVLHAAISRFKPQEAKEGGNMSDPERQGLLLKQGHGPFAKFKERQVHSYCQNCGTSLYCRYSLVIPKYRCPHFRDNFVQVVESLHRVLMSLLIFQGFLLRGYNDYYWESACLCKQLLTLLYVYVCVFAVSPVQICGSERLQICLLP